MYDLYAENALAILNRIPNYDFKILSSAEARVMNSNSSPFEAFARSRFRQQKQNKWKKERLCEGEYF